MKLDLGAEWTNKTGFPMVFGVFAGRKDSPIPILNRASNDMVRQYEIFLNNESCEVAIDLLNYVSSKELNYS